MNAQKNAIKRGEIYCADLSPVVGSEQGGMRPVLIIQNNVGNECSPTLIIAAITSKHQKAQLPTHVCLDDLSCGLEKNSIALLEQIRTIDNSRLKAYIGRLNRTQLRTVDRALLISVGLGYVPQEVEQYCRQQAPA